MKAQMVQYVAQLGVQALRLGPFDPTAAVNIPCHCPCCWHHQMEFCTLNAALFCRSPASMPSASAASASPPPPALVLLLARLCKALDATALPAAVEAAAAAFAGAGGGLGADQPPAFVAAQVSRCAG